MRPPTDRELLRRYVVHADEEAFADLVRRYVGFVHSAARRQTRGDAHLADDVTQAVMIVLARRAASVATGVPLASWLFTVTRHAAQNAMKMQARQRYHERRALASAARVERAALAPDEVEVDLRDALDDAIARLPEPDRSGVVLHFLQEHSHAEVGAALGLSADAARKRVERALEKMRLFLTGRGVAATGASIVAALHVEAASAAATTVPAQLVASTVNLAVLSAAGQATPAAGSLAIAKGVSHMLTLVKLKAAAAVALVVTAVAGATVTPLFQGAALRSVVTTTTSLATSSQQPAPANDARQPVVVRVTPDVRLEFLGVAPFPGDENAWFSIAGEPIDQPSAPLDHREGRGRAEADHQMLIRIHAPSGVVVSPQIEDARMSMNGRMNDDDDDVIHSRFSLSGPADSFNLRVGIAGAAWTTVATHENAQEAGEVDGGEYGTITFAPPEPANQGGGAGVEVAYAATKLPTRAVAIDADGKEHEARDINVRQSNDDVVSTFNFPVEPEQIRKVQFQVREFDKFVEVKEISLSPNHKTTPKITVTDAKKER